VLRNFLNLSKNANFSLELDMSTQDIFNGLVDTLSKKQKTYTKLRCTPVFLNFVELLTELMNNEDASQGLVIDFDKFTPLIKRCEKILKQVFNGEPIRQAFDVCESELIDRIIKLLFIYYSREGNEDSQTNMASLVDGVLSENISMLSEEDTNPLICFLTTVNNLPDVSFKLL
jgi:hypothetical protein